MELLQLRYFYESACNESITKTAQHYMVPTSSVSTSIKRLEQELGCELFERKGNRVRLNAGGRELQKALAVSLKTLDDAVASLASASEQSGEVRLLVRTERQYLLDRMCQFRREHPGVSFYLSHDHSAANFEQYDIIVDAPSANYAGFDGAPIVTEPILIAASAQNPLTRRPVKLAELSDQPFLSMSMGSSLHTITVDCCRKAGFHPNIIIESDDPQYLRKYLALDFGLMFVPSVSWQGQMEGTSYLQVTDLNEQRTTYAYCSRGRRLPPIAKAFYRSLLE